MAKTVEPCLQSIDVEVEEALRVNGRLILLNNGSNNPIGDVMGSFAKKAPFSSYC